ncbi:MAG: kelch repeat-containing protein [Chitinophagaceae bacterium]
MKQKFYTLFVLIWLLSVINISCKKDLNQPNDFLVELVPFGKLSIYRESVSVAATDNKLIFAGGTISAEWIDSAITTVDIYDKKTQLWTTANLSQARNNMCAITYGNKVFFAGGIESDGFIPSSRVDIYDAATNTWSITELSEPRGNIVAAVAGNKIVFTGGLRADASYNLISSSKADIYDANTNTWSTATLSQPRALHTVSAVGNKIYIAGGKNGSVSSTIDIYDAGTNTWTVSLLGEAKSNHAAAVVDDKIYWMGGSNGSTTSNRIEILNTTTQTTTTALLPTESEFFIPALSRNGQLILFSGYYNSKAYIFEISSGQWKQKLLKLNPTSIFACMDDHIYMAEGIHVWKVVF